MIDKTPARHLPGGGFVFGLSIVSQDDYQRRFLYKPYGSRPRTSQTGMLGGTKGPGIAQLQAPPAQEQRSSRSQQSMSSSIEHPSGQMPVGSSVLQVLASTTSSDSSFSVPVFSESTSSFASFSTGCPEEQATPANKRAPAVTAFIALIALLRTSRSPTIAQLLHQNLRYHSLHSSIRRSARYAKARRDTITAPFLHLSPPSPTSPNPLLLTHRRRSAFQQPAVAHLRPFTPGGEKITVT